MSLQDNLNRLRRELADFATQHPVCGERAPAHAETARHLAAPMPLCTARGDRGFVSTIEEGGILSRAEVLRLHPEQKKEVDTTSDEAILGTQDCVFTFAGPLRFANRYGFVFAAAVEAAHRDAARASPFDSGGLRHGLRPHDTDDQRRAFLAQHEMPVPGYRDYLADTLANLFASPWDYIDGIDPDPSGPLDFQGGDQRRWTFEVRFRTKLFLDQYLLVVFVPASRVTDEARKLTRGQEDRTAHQLAAWNDRGLLSPYGPEDDNGSADILLRQSIEWLKRHLA